MIDLREKAEIIRSAFLLL